MTTHPDALTDTGSPRTHFGFREVPLAEKQGLVDDVFHKVADRYDLMNDLMSGGLHRVWKDAMVAWLGLPRTARRPYRVIDVAGGTGDIATRIVERTDGHVKVTVCDINGSMLRVGEERAAKRGLTDNLSFVLGNAEDLPFEAASFDAYTIAFGIRNVPQIPKAIREAYRVLKPGGRFMVLEFSQVDLPVLDRIYDAYSLNVIPPLGRMVTGDGDPYQYLVESIRRFPHQERFAKMIRDGGFDRVEYRNLTGGVAAIHSGWKL